MIIGFGAKNIKACNIEELLDIKPITIFMGENSSGKSSFLQALSLLSMNEILGNDIKRIKYNNPFHKLGKVYEFKSKDNHVYLSFKFKDKQKNIYDISFFYNNDIKSDDYGYLNNIMIYTKHTKQNLSIVYAKGDYFIYLDSLIGEDNKKYFSKTILDNSTKILFKTDFDSLQLDSYPKEIEDEIIKHIEAFKKLEELLKDIFEILKDNISSIQHISRVKEIITHYNYSSDYIGYNGEKYKDIAKDLENTVFLEKAIKNIFNYNLDKIDEFGNCYLNQKTQVQIFKKRQDNKYYYFKNLGLSENPLKVKEIDNKIFLIKEDEEIELLKVNEESNLISYSYHEDISLGLDMFGSSVSNIIPALTQFAKNRENPEKYNLTIIEEPEIGLHPQAQAKLVETLFGEDDYYKTQTTILETHSEYIVNKLRYLVYKGKIKPEEVVIYYKQQDNDEFIQINIDKFGQFDRDFPKNFFDVTLNELLEMKRAKRKNVSS
ncbi:MAG: DUF3696 domain-containing protein [Sulfurovum sp.]